MAAKIHSMDNGRTVPLPEVQCSDLIGRRNRLAIQPLDMRRPAQRDGGSYSLQLDWKHAMMQMEAITMTSNTSGSYDDINKWFMQ